MRLSKSLFYIGLSTVLVSGSAAILLQRYKQKQRSFFADPDYYISTIVQTGPEKAPLPTNYLAQLIGLSLDEPTHLYHLSLFEAKRALLSSFLIKSARIKPVPPKTLYIEYTCRRPLFRLAEYANTAVDESGYLFPLEPYLTAKNLPELILSKPLKPPIWGQTIEIELPCALLKQTQVPIQRIDLSDIEAKSMGRRQLIIVTHQHILRLLPKHYLTGLSQYLQLRSKLDAKPQVIDLRLDSLAFIEPALKGS